MRTSLMLSLSWPSFVISHRTLYGPRRGIYLQEDHRKSNVKNPPRYFSLLESGLDSIKIEYGWIHWNLVTSIFLHHRIAYSHESVFQKMYGDHEPWMGFGSFCDGFIPVRVRASKQQPSIQCCIRRIVSQQNDHNRLSLGCWRRHG